MRSPSPERQAQAPDPHAPPRRLEIQSRSGCFRSSVVMRRLHPCAAVIVFFFFFSFFYRRLGLPSLTVDWKASRKSRASSGLSRSHWVPRQEEVEGRMLGSGITSMAFRRHVRRHDAAEVFSLLRSHYGEITRNTPYTPYKLHGPL